VTFSLSWLPGIPQSPRPGRESGSLLLGSNAMEQQKLLKSSSVTFSLSWIPGNPYLHGDRITVSFQCDKKRTRKSALGLLWSRRSCHKELKCL